VKQIVEELINVLGVHVERLVQSLGKARQFFQHAAKFDHSLANVSPIFSNQFINMSEQLIRFSGGFSEVL